jgi:hypothetical protein
MDAILRMTTNLKKVFVMCFEAEARNFTLVYSLLLNVGRSVLKVAENLWKNSLIMAKYILIIRVNFILIAITFSEKK